MSSSRVWSTKAIQRRCSHKIDPSRRVFVRQLGQRRAMDSVVITEDELLCGILVMVSVHQSRFSLPSVEELPENQL